MASKVSILTNSPHKPPTTTPPTCQHQNRISRLKAIDTGNGQCFLLNFEHNIPELLILGLLNPPHEETAYIPLISVNMCVPLTPIGPSIPPGNAHFTRTPETPRQLFPRTQVLDICTPPPQLAPATCGHPVLAPEDDYVPPTHLPSIPRQLLLGVQIEAKWVEEQERTLTLVILHKPTEKLKPP